MESNQYFNSNAVENTVFNFLAVSEKNYDFPSLQKDAVDAISNNIANVVYETLKQKSIAGLTKRSNLLKFLNNISQTREFHLDQHNYKIYLNAYKKEYCKNSNHKVAHFLQDISEELKDLNTDLKTDVMHFYKRKNLKRKQIVNKLEFIKQKDQEKMSTKPEIQVTRNISHYETSESLIKDLFEEVQAEKGNEFQINQFSREYREKQIKFCYALINLGDEEDIKILEFILQKLSRYKNLERFEVGFLTDLWLCGDKIHLDSTIFLNKFTFIIEKAVIQLCAEIVKLKDAAEVSRFFTSLDSDPKIQSLRRVCLGHPAFYCKMKSLIHELYVFSYCNRNVYRFVDCII